MPVPTTTSSSRSRPRSCSRASVRCCGAARPPTSCSRSATSSSTSATRIVPSRAGTEIALSAREAALLELLLRNPRQVVSRAQALEHVWGGAAAASLNVVDRYVSYLRRKLGEPHADPDGPRRRLRARAMIPRSLGARSTIAAALAILLALVVVGVGVDVLVARDLHRSLDRSLRQRAVEVAQLSASAPALLTAPGALDASLGGQQINVEVVDRRGRIVARSLALGGKVLPVETRAARRDRDRRRPVRRVPSSATSDLRVYVAPLAEAGGPAAGGAVAVAASTHDVDSTLASVRLLVLLAALARRGRRRRRTGVTDAPCASPARRGSPTRRRRSNGRAIRVVVCRSRRRDDEIGRLAHDAERHAQRSRALARRRAALPRRRVARAADAADRAGRQRRLPRAARRDRRARRRARAGRAAPRDDSPTTCSRSRARRPQPRPTRSSRSTSSRARPAERRRRRRSRPVLRARRPCRRSSVRSRTWSRTRDATAAGRSRSRQSQHGDVAALTRRRRRARAAR